MAIRRRTLTNLGLLILATALAAVLVFTQPAKKKPVTKPLTDIAPVSIHTITLTRRMGPEVKLRRAGDHWIMTAPVHARAAGERIQSLLDLLHATRHGHFPAEAKNLSRFGLDKPNASLRLNDHTFQFGDTEPLDNRRYVLYNHTVYLIDDYLYSQLTGNAGSYVDPALLPPDSRVTRIVYPHSTLALEHGAWKQQPPSGKKETDLKSIALNWETASAILVRTAQHDKVQGEVTVDLKKGAPITFDISGQGANPVLVRSDLGLAYHLDSYTARQLLLEPSKPAPKKPK